LPEVFEIVVVAHGLGIHGEAEVPRQFGNVVELQTIPGVRCEVVFGQIVHIERAVLALRQIARLTREIDAAPAVVHRFEREVERGSDVPVVGNRKLHAAAGGVAEAREEKAALALVAQREGQPGQIEQGHALEIHARRTPGADALLGVERDAPGTNLPCFVIFRAGREFHVIELDDAGWRHMHGARLAARRALAQLELGGGEIGAPAC
jgi:hypothetical protein